LSYTASETLLTDPAWSSFSSQSRADLTCEPSGCGQCVQTASPPSIRSDGHRTERDRLRPNRRACNRIGDLHFDELHKDALGPPSGAPGVAAGESATPQLVNIARRCRRGARTSQPSNNVSWGPRHRTEGRVSDWRLEPWRKRLPSLTSPCGTSSRVRHE
jgi:hypothetical protein